MTPLAIQVLFHSKSEASRSLAHELYRRFMAVGGAPGLRIPVAFMPLRDDGLPQKPELDCAERTLVVLLADGRMALRARPEDARQADAWGELATDLQATTTAAGCRHGFLPVAVDGGGLRLDARLGNISFVRLDRFDATPEEKPAELCFHVAVSALLLLRDRDLPDQPPQRAPLQLFVSHAKIDLPPDQETRFEGPALELLAYLAQGPVDGWYDAKKIDRGTNFEEAITRGIARCDVVVAVISDHWSEREWCRREVLITKELGKPLVVVDALSSEVGRLFAYLGNTRALRWQPGSSRAVLLAVLLEALRHSHALKLLGARKKEGDHLLGVQPEILTLKRLPAGTRRVVYPDPPLPREEIRAASPILAIEAGVGNSWTARPVELTTPLTEIGHWNRPRLVDMVALSLSGSDDIEKWGASSEHLGTLADDLVTMLLLAGLRLAYGGVLDHGGTQTDNINYTTRLFGLVRSYSPWATDLGAARFHPIVNFVSWPVHCAYGDAELARYGQEAVLEPGPRPDLGGNLEEIGLDARGFAPRDTPARIWAHARGLTEMRIAVSRQISGRIALAGRLDSYSGLLPGVLEEILITRCGEFGGAPAPLFLIGAFGGVSRYAIDLLESRHRHEATTSWVAARLGSYQSLVAEYAKRGGRITTPEEAAERLGQLGKEGPARALDNGLDDAENREMFTTTDGHRIVELILTGLGRRFAAA